MESSVIARWLYETLHGDVTLMGMVNGVYEQPAPLTSQYPMVIFSQQYETDVVTGDSHNRIMSDQSWLVRAIVEAPSYASAIDMAARIDALLEGSSGSPTGGLVIKCVRTNGFRGPEVNNGKEYRHLGGIYRLLAQTT